MSETVHYKGIANLVDIPDGKTLVQVAEDILKEKDPLYELPANYDNDLEYLTYTYYEEYFYHPTGNALYRITKNSIDPYDDIIKATRRDNGEIEYELRYYNGGAGFEECLEEAMDKLMDKEYEH